MPSSVKDRFSVDYEPFFFWSRSKNYWFERQFEPQSKGTFERYKEGEKIPSFKKEGGSARKTHSFSDGMVGILPNGRNKRCVWRIPTQSFPESHFAVFPEKLVETPIKAGCPEFICTKCGVAREAVFEPSEEYKKLLGKGYITKEQEIATAKNEGKPGSASRIETYMDSKPVSTTADYKKTGYTNCGCGALFRPGIVLDPFVGSGTTLVVAQKLRRDWIGIELNPSYIQMAMDRLSQPTLL